MSFYIFREITFPKDTSVPIEDARKTSFYFNRVLRKHPTYMPLPETCAIDIANIDGTINVRVSVEHCKDGASGNREVEVQNLETYLSELMDCLEEMGERGLLSELTKVEDTKKPEDVLPSEIIDYIKGRKKTMDFTHYFHADTHVQTNLLAHRMLAPWLLRDYVVDKIKTPLHEALLKGGRRLGKKVVQALILSDKRFLSKFGEITKDKTAKKNTHNILDIKKKFFEYEHNAQREPLFNALFDTWAYENEHDPYYEDRMGFILEEVVKLILLGEWTARPEGRPPRRYPDRKDDRYTWEEPPPYGGRHSIISRLQEHKEEILRILEVKDVKMV